METIKSKGIELGMSECAAYLLDNNVKRATMAANEAKSRLVTLLAELESDDPERALSAIRSMASTIGYSNTVGTSVTELAAAVGAVAGMLEQI